MTDKILENELRQGTKSCHQEAAAIISTAWAKHIARNHPGEVGGECRLCALYQETAKTELERI